MMIAQPKETSLALSTFEAQRDLHGLFLTSYDCRSHLDECGEVIVTNHGASSMHVQWPQKTTSRRINHLFGLLRVKATQYNDQARLKRRGAWWMHHRSNRSHDHYQSSPLIKARHWTQIMGLGTRDNQVNDLVAHWLEGSASPSTERRTQRADGLSSRQWLSTSIDWRDTLEDTTIGLWWTTIITHHVQGKDSDFLRHSSLLSQFSQSSMLFSESLSQSWLTVDGRLLG